VSYCAYCGFFLFYLLANIHNYLFLFYEDVRAFRQVGTFYTPLSFVYVCRDGLRFAKLSDNPEQVNYPCVQHGPKRLLPFRHCGLFFRHCGLAPQSPLSSGYGVSVSGSERLHPDNYRGPPASYHY